MPINIDKSFPSTLQSEANPSRVETDELFEFFSFKTKFLIFLIT